MCLFTIPITIGIGTTYVFWTRIQAWTWTQTQTQTLILLGLLKT